ncbi:MAG: GFA family protein [Polyangiales bacterium]
MSTTKTFRGSCQCGAVKLEAAFDLAQGTSKCNCTSCWKRRWWSVRVQPEGFKLHSGEDKLDKEGGFCRGCGIRPFAKVEAAEWNDGAYVSVNVAVLDDLDPRELMAAPIQLCDGRNDDWWHKPEFSGHL